jgi:hypothetical protein
MTLQVASGNIAARVRIYYVPRASIDDHWPAILELLAPAIEREARNTGPEDVYDDIAAGNSLAWVVKVEDNLVGAFITALSKHPRRLTIRIDYLGGDRFEEWWQLALDVVVDVARGLGGSAFEATARDGWMKYAGRSQFKRRWAHYEMGV